MDKKQYKHLFFDLDHTLWDFDTNSQVVLRQIYIEVGLNHTDIPFEDFHATYLPVNAQYWARYHNGLLTQEQLRIGRFLETLRRFRIYDLELATTISGLYTSRSPYQTGLLPDAIETLDYLFLKYGISIITNGFAEIQEVKIRESGLEKYFQHIFISGSVGHQKPAKEIFLHAVETAGTTITDSLMIGDNMQTDIAGAKSVGMDQVLFNPKHNKTKESATYMISNLSELMNIL